MTSKEIRKRFLSFFEQRGHRVVPSSSLVPANDPTLLFTNAGMNQFKDVFLGREKRDYLRACSSQKCVRAGGKHNDLEQVGRTTRHHTFFEMLGNFSFGDYFKKEAIPWAWELLTKDFAIPKDKLYVTVFEQSEVSPGQVVKGDHESLMFWSNKDVPVPADHIRLLGADTNFWFMGHEGPCGPCSEVHYDMGPEASDLSHKDCAFPCDCGRYVELWNLVFMQFNRVCDNPEQHDLATCERFHLEGLPTPCVDTGAGLERLATVLQGKISNFDTDLFRPLIEEAAELANAEYGSNHETDVSLRIIADHARAATFLIFDGVLPSNEGRGYVLRRIMRRAMVHSRMLGAKDPFLHQVTRSVTDLMQGAYPELLQSAKHVSTAVKAEEKRFADAVEQALAEWDGLIVRKKVERLLAELDREKPSASSKFTDAFGLFLKRKDPTPLFEAVKRELGSERAEQFQQEWEAREIPPVTIEGQEAFRLWDTFGLSLDFMQEIARDQGHSLDVDGFQRAMGEQRERARASWKGADKKLASPVYQQIAEKQKTAFDGYTQTSSTDCRIVALVANGQAASEAKPGTEVEVIFDHTPFYAEAGGQIGDTGHLLAPGGTHEVAHVNDTYSPVSGLIAHKAVAKHSLRVGDLATAQVDAERRDAIRRNHTATHLLHASLRKTLGTHVKQAGSLVAPDRLRFDFTHYAPLDEQDLLDIEDLVNEHVLANQAVETQVMDLDAAINSGAMALFGEKYGDKVRVVSITDFSKELCGGTHVRRTGDIGLFKVVSEASVAAGTRRIEALTGEGVLEYLRRLSQTQTQLSERLRAKPDELLQATEKLLRSEKLLRELLLEYQRREALEVAEALVRELQKATADQKKVAVPGGYMVVVAARDSIPVVSARVPNMDRETMRLVIDSVRPKVHSAVIVLGSVSDGSPGQVALVAAVTKDLTGRLDAGKIVKEIATLVGGTGGGRKDLAEAGGKKPEKLDETLQAVPSIVEKML